jgi:CBS domain-containing protein
LQCNHIDDLHHDPTSNGSLIALQNNGKTKGAVGIITERDVVRILEPWLLTSPLRTLMSKPVITISANSSLRDGIQTMYTKNIRRLPVVSHKKTTDQIVGIITSKDIFRVLMKNQNLVQSLITDDILGRNMKTVQEQFAEYWFGDILIHKK